MSYTRKPIQFVFLIIAILAIALSSAQLESASAQGGKSIQQQLITQTPPPPEIFEKKMPVVIAREGASRTPFTSNNLIQDPSFEASFGSQAYWSQSSTNFGTPLCTSAACGNGGGTAGPRTGSTWAWFGGTPFDEYAVVSQNAIFPSCGAKLEFYFWIGYAGQGSDIFDYFQVLIDSNEPPAFIADATQISSYPTYKLVSIDLSSYADGNTHTIQFFSYTKGQVVTFNLDDVSLVSNCSSVNVNVGGTGQGNYALATGQSKRVSYAGLNNGPVKIQSLGGSPIVASERVAYSPDGGTTWTSHSELMGLPANQLTSSYTFPWYNNADLNSQLRFGNVGASSTIVTVTIGGVVRGIYTLAANQSTRISYSGLDSGPVKVTSAGNVPIIASLRVAYHDGTSWTSYSEMMGLPSNPLTNNYIFPWYNNLSLDSQIRFGNVGTAPTNVTVTIAGQVQGTYTLQPNASKRIKYPGLDQGPVRITSSGNVPIIASMRVAYHDGTSWTDFSEMMGLPSSSLSTHYSFPAYNNVSLNTQLRFGNVGTSTTTVTVTVGGQVQGTYSVAPNQSRRISYALDSGPVVIQSSGGVPIIASVRVAYFNGSAWTSFAEMMGMPREQLASLYLFPWYNNVDLNTQMRFGVP